MNMMHAALSNKICANHNFTFTLDIFSSIPFHRSNVLQKKKKKTLQLFHIPDYLGHLKNLWTPLHSFSSHLVNQYSLFVVCANHLRGIKHNLSRSHGLDLEGILDETESTFAQFSCCSLTSVKKMWQFKIHYTGEGIGKLASLRWNDIFLPFNMISV